MSFLSFFGFYSKQKMNDVAKDVTQKIVSIDPEGATEAQLDMMMSKLHEISKNVSKYRRAYEKDLQETEEWKERLHNTISAIELLESDLESSSDSAAEKIGRAIDKLLDEVEKIEGEIAREESEDIEAKEILEEFEKAEKELATKIKETRESMRKLSQDIERAKHKRDRAAEKLKGEKERAGLTHSIDSLSLANDYMKAELQQLQEEEDALKSQTELFKEHPAEESDLVASALSRVEGKSHTLSRAERLAQLRKNRG
jgi:chromosome segregation ATPase